MNRTSKYTECGPTIIWDDTLSTGDGIFMDKELIDDKCDCKHSDLCKTAVDYLNNKKKELAKNLLDNLIRWVATK